MLSYLRPLTNATFFVDFPDSSQLLTCRDLYKSFPDSSVGKESTRNAGDPGSIPGLGRSPGEGKGYPLQYSGLENSMDSIVHGVAKSQSRLSDYHMGISELPWWLSW